jgi:hypothetical protein
MSSDPRVEVFATNPSGSEARAIVRGYFENVRIYAYTQDSQTQAVMPTGGNVFDFVTITNADGINVAFSIQTERDLREMRPDRWYQLVNNVEISSHNWVSDLNFANVLDGRNFSISGLSIDTTNGSTGLFNSITSTGVVRNLRIEFVRFDVRSGHLNNTIGGLAAQNFGTIENVAVSFRGAARLNYTSTAIGGTSHVGMLVGQNAGIITNSTANGNISMSTSPGHNFVGGIAGRNTGSIIGVVHQTQL